LDFSDINSLLSIANKIEFTQNPLLDFKGLSYTIQRVFSYRLLYC